jgi:hypothetical protein
MSVINPEMHDLQEQVAEQRVRLANTEGRIDEVRRTASGTVRQTIWQFVIFTVTMAAVLLGGLNYQTEALRREFNARFDTVNARFDSVDARFDSVDARFDDMDKRFDARFDDMNRRFDARFDDMNKRFEDLKQVVLSRQKQ